MNTDNSKYTLYQELNRSFSEFSYSSSIPDIFNSIYEQYPNNIAIVEGNKELSFKELNFLSNKLANYILTKYKIRGKNNIGIYLNRGINAYVSMLGILKMNATYVPLDLFLPLERVSYIIKDAEIDILITSKTTNINNDLKKNVNYLVYIEDVIECEINNEDFICEITSDSPAYIMYTSGTTGNPKGVKIPHRGIVRLVKSNNYLEIRTSDSILQYAPLGFDASTFEIWGSILNGAKLIVFQKNLGTLEEIGELIVSSGVNILWLTTGLFNEMVEHNITAFGKVDFVLTGGDVVSVKHVNKLIKKYSCKVINGYGPTENTTFTTSYKVTEPIEESFVPIGKPIANTEVYVFNEEEELVDINQVGELYVAGDGLALGYVNGENSSFIKRKIFNDIERTLYKTGDLVRILPNLNLQFLGRIDNQIKVRGFRVELDEIRNKLLSIKNIKDAYIRVINESTQKQIIGYLLIKNDFELEEMNEIINKTLPHYLVPDLIIPVGEFPLKVNGKIDLDKLPLNNENNKKTLRPSTPIQHELLELYGEILKQENIEIDKSFFYMGGNSLLSMRVISKIKKIYNVKIKYEEFFENSSITQLASLINNKKSEILNINDYESKHSSNRSYLCSVGQQSLWLRHKLLPNDYSYNIVKLYELNGNLSVLKLTRAINLFLKNNQGIRTSFYENEGLIYQKIKDYNYVDIPIIDLENIIDAEVKINKMIDREVSYVFDLINEDLYRFYILKLSNERYCLILNIHHIVIDGNSIELMLKELSLYYNNENGTHLSNKAAYIDFSNTQHSKEIKLVYKKQLKFWEETLNELPKNIIFPLEKNNYLPGDISGNRLIKEIPLPLKSKLEALVKKKNTTMFMFLLTTLNILIGKLTGDKKVYIGTPVSMRNIDEKFENTIGNFVNTITLKCDLTGNHTFDSLLKMVTENTIKCFDNKDVPLEEIVKLINPKRDIHQHSPFFNVLFNYHNYEKRKLDFINVDCIERQTTSVTSRFDFSFNVVNSKDSIDLEILYKRNKYSGEFITILMDSFLELLNSILEKSAEDIETLNYISIKEKEKCISFQLGKTSPLDSKVRINNLFEEQVYKQPNNIACIFEENRITYLDLDNDAKKIARFLINNKVKEGDYVFVEISKKPLLISLILAIWKIGAIYVPLNINMPNEFKRNIIEQISNKFLVTEQKNNFDYIDESTNLINLDDESYKQLKANINDLPPLVWNEIAYVTFTSGTTGIPKGVKARHTSVVNYMQYLKNEILINSNDTVLQIPPITFDASIRDIFGTLTVGGRLILPSETEDKNPSKLAHLIESYNVTSILSVVPSFLEYIIREYKDNYKKINNCLKKIALSGEKFSKSLLDEIALYLGDSIIVINQYGPTECTLTSTYHKIKSDDHQILIGKPIQNQRLYILDENMSIVPRGVKGKIYISGVGVSDGYLNNETLNKKFFIKDPFINNMKMYDTGDIGFYHENGSIEYVGRSNRQIKIFGERIELEGIENVINQLPYINKICVLYNQNEKILEGYLTSEFEITSDQLSSDLLKMIPNNLIPSKFFQIDSIPLKENGKIDLNALKIKQYKRISGKKYLDRDMNEFELKMRDIWSEFLGGLDIGLVDNFFELGGQSILAIQVIARVKERFHVNVTVRDIFENPTIKQLCEIIKSRPKEEKVIDDFIRTIPRG